MNNNKSRNCSIEFLRLAFIILICFHHFQSYLNIKIINSGYLGVEFFFILSGFYLYKTFIENNQLTSWRYTYNKIEKYFLSYMIALGITLIADIIVGNSFDFQKTLFIPISETFMLQNIRYILWWI